MKRRKQKTRLWHQPGEPIPGEVEARMSKPLERPALFQVWVERRNGKPPIAVGPKADKDFCERFVSVINQMIIDGKERLWGNPHIVSA